MNTTPQPVAIVTGASSTIAAARFGVTDSARAQSNKTTPVDLRAIKVQQMAPAAIRLPII
jgi:hypothetical protein